MNNETVIGSPYILTSDLLTGINNYYKLLQDFVMINIDTKEDGSSTLQLRLLNNESYTTPIILTSIPSTLLKDIISNIHNVYNFFDDIIPDIQGSAMSEDTINHMVSTIELAMESISGYGIFFISHNGEDEVLYGSTYHLDDDKGDTITHRSMEAVLKKTFPSLSGYHRRKVHDVIAEVIYMNTRLVN